MKRVEIKRTWSLRRFDSISVSYGQDFPDDVPYDIAFFEVKDKVQWMMEQLTRLWGSPQVVVEKSR